MRRRRRQVEELMSITNNMYRQQEMGTTPRLRCQSEPSAHNFDYAVETEAKENASTY